MSTSVSTYQLHTDFPLSYTWLQRAAVSLFPRPAVSPQGWVETVVLITQVDVQQVRERAHPCWARRPHWQASGRVPWLGCSLSSGSVGGQQGGRRGVLPLPGGARGGNKKQCDFAANGPRHYDEVVQLMVLKLNKHEFGSWSGFRVFFLFCLRLQFTSPARV